MTLRLLLVALLYALGAAPGVAEQSGETWRGLRVESEQSREGYRRLHGIPRDTEIWDADGRPECAPYSRRPIDRVGRGDGLDREHIVALAEAWDSRPADADESFGLTMAALDRDHDNLTLARARENRSKGDRDAGEWLPDHNRFWYANRVVEVKRRYDLSVDPAERDALEAMLAQGGIDEITCGGLLVP